MQDLPCAPHRSTTRATCRALPAENLIGLHRRTFATGISATIVPITWNGSFNFDSRDNHLLAGDPHHHLARLTFIAYSITSPRRIPCDFIPTVRYSGRDFLSYSSYAPHKPF